jgi:uncharacterized protein
VWILTDGKAGDVAQCLGILNFLCSNFHQKVVRPKPLFSFFPNLWPFRYGLCDPFVWKELKHDFFIEKPRLIVASGRRTVPYINAIKKNFGDDVFIVFLKNPQCPLDIADFVWMPIHDQREKAVENIPCNSYFTVTSPHNLTQTRLQDAKNTEIGHFLASFPTPRIGVIVGGNSRHHTFTAKNIRDFQDQIKRFMGGSLFITASRRTPHALRESLQQFAQQNENVFLWDGTGENPYAAMLALCDAVIVTADSTNMVGEAAITGKPVLIFEPSGGHRKITHFLNSMAEMGVTRRLEETATLPDYEYTPINATPEIAARIEDLFLKK